MTKPSEIKTEEAKAPKTQKYVVKNGAIAPNGGGRYDLVKPGEVVELDSKTAKHYIGLDRLAPYVEDEDGQE